MDATNAVTIQLPYRPPLHWETLLNFFRIHEIAGLEAVGENSYERIFRHAGEMGHVLVQPSTQEAKLELRLTIDDPSALPEVSARIRRMFDLDVDPLVIAEHFAKHSLLKKIGKKHPGLRLARAWDPFESAIATILGQLVSLAQARRLVGQLVAAYGEAIVHPLTGAPARLFPTAEVLAQASLAEVGTTGRRKLTIREFARRIAAGELHLSDAHAPEALKKSLLEIPGIGPWSAEYISLRALGHSDAFPATDLILKRALDRHPDVDFSGASPWRAYAAVYLWKEYALSLGKPAIKGVKK